VPKKNCHPDKKVTTSQDDDFVGVSKKNILKQVSAYGISSWVVRSRPYRDWFLLLPPGMVCAFGTAAGPG
jgi:hypothetical protein